MSLEVLVPIPPKEGMNGGRSACPTRMLIEKYGSPRAKLTQDCAAVTAPFWKSRITTMDVGPFRATGHFRALQLLQKSLAKVKERNPELYNGLGSAGMLCCRLVRGSKSTLSNHGLGLAIDFTFGGKLDARGDGKCIKAMLELYAILKEDGWYWGAEFPTEDSMHFEVSAEKVNEWIRDSVF